MRQRAQTCICGGFTHIDVDGRNKPSDDADSFAPLRLDLRWRRIDVVFRAQLDLPDPALSLSLRKFGAAICTAIICAHAPMTIAI